MNLPIFKPLDDPGPSFVKLLGRIDLDETKSVGSIDRMKYAYQSETHLSVPHGTTIAAVRFADGVVMAGDRRATEGNFIAHRRIEKVFAADRHSGVAIAGAAGPAVEMVRLFQVQLEHYEKVEGSALSLEGKANQLSQMIRANLPMAMQGLAVVPLFAGWDTLRRRGKIFTYDITGGRYEEVDYHATGSGGRDAKATIKLGFREDMDDSSAIKLLVQALLEASEEDSATGGPDPIRGIYPVIATITESGFKRIKDDDIASISEAVIAERRQRGGSQ